MSFVTCGRPFPVTQHDGDALPLRGQPCTAQAPCCGGAGHHDSHYVCVKSKANTFLPCPAREQPDFDEIVLFNRDAVLPIASVEFMRRRRTLLWLDANPLRNFALLRKFPGCPQLAALLKVPAYPMRPHCGTCKYSLTMDANPYSTFLERQKTVEVSEMQRDKLLAAVRADNVGAQEQLQGSIDRLRLAEAALAESRAAADAVERELTGRHITMEEQTDVLLFPSVGEISAFLRAHPELSKSEFIVRVSGRLTHIALQVSSLAPAHRLRRVHAE